MTAQKFWKIVGFQKMINSHDVQLVNYRLAQKCRKFEEL